MTDTSMAELLHEASSPEQRDANTWAQCFVEADGDESKARALYVKRKLPQPIQPQKGFCPSCTAECRMDARSCPMCGADFIGGGWKPSLTKPRPAYGAKVHNDSRPVLMKAAKSRGIYIILGILFGMLGIHNFYAGRYGRGAFQLLSTVLLGWVVIGLVITAIWVLIDLFSVTTDGEGDQMA